MPRHIALLRGVNVGGHRRVNMPALRELLTSLGYGDVRTYVQSGNVVLTSRKSAGRLERDLEKEIADGMGVDPLVLVRTRDELADVVGRDPFGDEVTNPKHYVVTFLSGEPATEVVQDLSAIDTSPEQYVFGGREIYSWHPDGYGRSQHIKRLTDKRLGVTTTARNWRTVTTLLAMADEGLS
jgi:uncharacterized protein (DUF1697 family)